MPIFARSSRMSASMAACDESSSSNMKSSVVALQAARAVAADSASARSRSVPARWGARRVVSRHPLRVQV
jgi:hypothetical protein